VITPVCNPIGIAFSIIQYITIPVFVNAILLKKAFFLKKTFRAGGLALPYSDFYDIL